MQAMAGQHEGSLVGAGPITLHLPPSNFYISVSVEVDGHVAYFKVEDNMDIFGCPLCTKIDLGGYLI